MLRFAGFLKCPETQFGNTQEKSEKQGATWHVEYSIQCGTGYGELQTVEGLNLPSPKLFSNAWVAEDVEIFPWQSESWPHILVCIRKFPCANST